MRSVDKVCSVSDTQGEAVQTTSQIANHRCHRILGNSMKAMDVHPQKKKGSIVPDPSTDLLTCGQMSASHHLDRNNFGYVSQVPKDREN